MTGEKPAAGDFFFTFFFLLYLFFQFVSYGELGAGRETGYQLQLA